MNEVTAQLVVRQGPETNQAYSLTQPRTILGRSKSNEISIVDLEISREHAQIIRSVDGFTIEDLGSTNGTFINGERIVSPTRLRHGDVIGVGEVVQLVFMSETAAGWSAADQVGTAEATLVEDAPDSYPDDSFQDDLLPLPDTSSNRRRWLWGCGCGFLLLVFLCGATLFFLDAYDGGRLLYCGLLQPLFEFALGSFGFSPACALP